MKKLFASALFMMLNQSNSQLNALKVNFMDDVIYQFVKQENMEKQKDTKDEKFVVS